MFKIVEFHRSFTDLECYRLNAKRTYAVTKQLYDFIYTITEVKGINPGSTDYLDMIFYKSTITVYDATKGEQKETD